MRVNLVYRGVHLYRQAMDLEVLAPVLRSAGHRVTVTYDPDTFGVTDNVVRLPRLAGLLARDEKTVSEIVDSRPDVVVFNVLPATFAWCREVSRELKRRTPVPVVFLGLHPSLVPEHVMADLSVDYVIAGEAEGVINRLLEEIGSGGDVSRVGNLWYRDGGGTPVYTHRAELVDLDALPLPDKELFARYVTHGYSYSTVVSRGCPFNCTFCEETCVKSLYGSKYFRRKSVDTVMRELVAGRRRYRYREVIFKDSYLSGNKTWLRELMERYRREIRVPFKCFCTISGFDEETARLLKQGGCYSVEFGLQTWNDDVRRTILNRRETSEDAFRAFEHCAKQRLRYDVDHMFFLPNESEADHVHGAECYQRLRHLGRIKVHFLLYLPTANIVEHGLASGDLVPGVRERLADGLESNFYDQDVLGHQRRRTAAGYAVLYKILPLLPPPAARWLLRNGRVRHLRRLPSALTAALQAAHAVRCGDLRFLAYLQMYPRKVFRTVADRIGPLRPPQRSSP